jgi:hypothetical protein
VLVIDVVPPKKPAATSADRGREGQIPPEDFIETLLGSEVLMPTFATHAVGGLKTECRALPFKLVE